MNRVLKPDLGRAFFIPTKNQPEQEYLARYLEKKGIAPYAEIENFSKEKVLEVEKHKGLKVDETQFNHQLFSLFKRK